jgi:hypothetical protein
MSAARFGIAVKDATVYTTMQPCFGCLKMIMSASIERVVFCEEWKDDDKPDDKAGSQEYTKIKMAFVHSRGFHGEYKKEFGLGYGPYGGRQTPFDRMEKSSVESTVHQMKRPPKMKSMDDDVFGDTPTRE